MYHFGTLLSHWQGKVDYSTLSKCGVEFLNIKSSEGNKFRDMTYDIHVQGGRSESMGIIAFHYWKPVGALANFNKFMEVTENNPPDLYEIDWEFDGKSILSTLSELMDLAGMLIMRTKKLPLLYTNPDFGNRYHKYIMSSLTKLPLHVASYNRGYPLQVKPWAGWDIWQTTKNGKLLGINGSACIEVMHTNFQNLVDKVSGKEYHND